MSTINSRIGEIIEWKFANSKVAFANFFEYTKPYVSKLIGDGSVGLEPVRKILEAFTDINARWLILGVGERQDPEVVLGFRTELYRGIKSLLDAERYLPYMTEQEFSKYKSSAAALKPFQFTDEQFERWVRLSGSDK